MMKKTFLLIPALLLLLLSTGCEDFINPEQGLVLPDNEISADEVELRSISLGLYTLQQDLVEQIVILGELRGDLLNVTENADPELREISTFQVSEGNRYASPSNFYKLIAASNKVIRILEQIHPEVLDKNSPITNFHRMYGEAVVMRSWAYFNAVRIFNEIPYVPETLNTIEEINEYINTPGEYTDDVYIDYSNNVINIDTIYDTTFVYSEKKFLNQDQMTRRCIKDIKEKVRVVGVDYTNLDQINDQTWNLSVWNEDALSALMVQMYVHIDNFQGAIDILVPVFLRPVLDVGSNNIKYGLDRTFSMGSWEGIFTRLNSLEHIFAINFQKTSASWQLNNLQKYFSNRSPNIYALKPSGKAIRLWEAQWRNYRVELSRLVNGQLVELPPRQVTTTNPGQPGDFSRGYGSSYIYTKNGIPLSNNEVRQMLNLKKLGFWDEVNDIMQGVDTVAYKYSIDKGPYDNDAFFIIYRAAAMHLYAAEIYTNYTFFINSILKPDISAAEAYIYDGNYIGTSDGRLGVAGRAGFSSKLGKSVDKDVYYIFDPNNNEVIGYNEINTIPKKQLYMEEIIMQERARELAYEGERFYDYIRIAKRREKYGHNGIEWLANKISESRPSNEREAIKARLMDESNWYLPFVLK